MACALARFDPYHPIRYSMARSDLGIQSQKEALSTSWCGPKLNVPSKKYQLSNCYLHLSPIEAKTIKGGIYNSKNLVTTQEYKNR